MIVYAASKDDPRRDSSQEVLDAVASRRAVGTTSSAVLEEVWHLELSWQVRATASLAEAAHSIFRPLLLIDDEVVEIAFGLELPEDTRLGANDRIHAATCIRYGIAGIVTADRAFDDVAQLHRIDPLDTEALADLW